MCIGEVFLLVCKVTMVCKLTPVHCMLISQENLPTTSLNLKILEKRAKMNSKPTSTKQQKPKPLPKPLKYQENIFGTYYYL